MFDRNVYRACAYGAFLVLMNQIPSATADDVRSFATGGYANQLRTPAMMQKIDTNNDRMVSKSEWDTYQENLFSMMDADESGALEQGEFEGSAPRHMVSFATGGFANALRTGEMRTRLDSDHDGRVSREEFLAYQTRLFDIMDSARTRMIGQNEFFGRGPRR